MNEMIVQDKDRNSKVLFLIFVVVVVKRFLPLNLLKSIKRKKQASEVHIEKKYIFRHIKWQ